MMRRIGSLCAVLTAVLVYPALAQMPLEDRFYIESFAAATVTAAARPIAVMALVVMRP